MIKRLGVLDSVNPSVERPEILSVLSQKVPSLAEIMAIWVTKVDTFASKLSTFRLIRILKIRLWY